MTEEQRRRGTLEAIDRILNRGEEADQVLRDVLAALSQLYQYAAIEFVEHGKLVRGPEIGEPTSTGIDLSPGLVDSDEPARIPIRYRDAHVGNLVVEPADDEDVPFLERVALLISAHVLIGWDTRGEVWAP